MSSYKDLIVWQKAMQLVKKVYSLTQLLPREELYGLASQMKRAAVSVPCNIAEGFRRNHRQEQIQFFAVSYGSGAELETQIEICKQLGFAKAEQTKVAEDILNEVMRMLNTFSIPMSRRLQDSTTNYVLRSTF
ncbi:four helix bundle protein [Patescibacteria group bacterium]|nr:MAG: four helix bundle protein [Patescibacteria group bacterium]